MLAQKFLTICRNMIDEIEMNEMANINQVASVIAEAVKNDGNVYIHDRGHMLNSELIVRAGGLALLKKLNVNMGAALDGISDAGHEKKNKVEVPEKEIILKEYEQKLAAYSIVNAGLCKGDVLILGSVSGKASIIVELAIAAKKIGITTVGLTSLKYSKGIKSSHPSGKRLFEVVDYIIDNHSDLGDASVEVDGLDEKICPTSGINAAIIGWCLIAQVVEHLMSAGIKPGVYRSVNLPGGEELFKLVNEHYFKRGY